MTSLTERYLAAALRGIPESQRADVERELRSSIADAVEDRISGGEDRTTAERGVLEGMGEPTRLAAGITGRSLYLIGPDLFLVWRHILVMLLTAAVPIVAVVLAVLRIADGGDYWDAVATGVGGAWNVAVHIGFWVTATFAIMERVDAMRDARDEITKATGRWTVDMLPEPPANRVSAGEMVGDVLMTALTIGALLFLDAPDWFRDESGAVIPLFNPGLWTGWLPVLISVLVALAALQVIVFMAGRWTMTFAAVHAALQIAFAVPVIGLAVTGSLINPAFAEAVGWPALADGNGPAMLAIAAGVLLVSAWEIFDAFRRARRTVSASVAGDSPATSS